MEQVAVIVPVFNIIPRKQFLLPTLRSVYKQTLISKLKVYLVDDGSSDGTQQYIQSLSQDEFKNLEIILLPQNVGKHQLLNTVVSKYVGTDYFVILDSDDLLMPTAIEKMLKLMESNSTLSCVKTGAVILSHGSIDFKTIVPQNPDFFRHLIHYFGAFIGNTGSLWKTKVFMKTFRHFEINTDDGRLSRLACEDGLRLYLMDSADWNFDAVNESLLVYRMHSLQWTSDKSNMGACDQLLYEKYRKNLPLRAFIIPEITLLNPVNKKYINKLVYIHLINNSITSWFRNERNAFLEQIKLLLKIIPLFSFVHYAMVLHLILLIFFSRRTSSFGIYKKLKWWWPRTLGTYQKMKNSEKQLISMFLKLVDPNGI
jgi:glycosyltransferase involved in cell wall biosynthesis